MSNLLGIMEHVTTFISFTYWEVAIFVHEIQLNFVFRARRNL